MEWEEIVIIFIDTFSQSYHKKSILYQGITKTGSYIKWKERVMIFTDTFSQHYHKRGPVAECDGWRYQRYLEVEQLLLCLMEQNAKIKGQ